MACLSASILRDAARFRKRLMLSNIRMFRYGYDGVSGWPRLIFRKSLANAERLPLLLVMRVRCNINTIDVRWLLSVSAKDETNIESGVTDGFAFALPWVTKPTSHS